MQVNLIYHDKDIISNKDILPISSATGVIQTPITYNKPYDDYAKNDDNDLCLDCGREVKSAIWGGRCYNHTTVHQQPCDLCSRICGIIVEDDYCYPKNLICPNCMDNARKKFNAN